MAPQRAGGVPAIWLVVTPFNWVAVKAPSAVAPMAEKLGGREAHRSEEAVSLTELGGGEVTQLGGVRTPPSGWWRCHQPGSGFKAWRRSSRCVELVVES